MNLLHVFVLKETYCIKLPSASDIKGWQPSLFKNRKLKRFCIVFSKKHAYNKVLGTADFTS